jgi:hypothetical protein
VPKECENFYSHFLNKTSNVEFYELLSNNEIKKMEMCSIDDVEVQSKMYVYVIWVFVLFIILRLVFTIFDQKLFKFDDLNIEDSYISNAVNEETDINENIDKTEKIITNSSITNNSNRFLYKLHKILSFKNGFKNLHKKKTKYYNDTGLELIGLIRAILIF